MVQPMTGLVFKHTNGCYSQVGMTLSNLHQAFPCLGFCVCWHMLRLSLAHPVSHVILMYMHGSYGLVQPDLTPYLTYR